MCIQNVGICTPTFYGDFKSRTINGFGNHNWMDIQVVDQTGFAIIPCDRGICAKVRVNSGDDDGGGSGTERAEVVNMQTSTSNPLYENRMSGIQRYSFSVKFDPTWKTMTKNYQGNGDWGVFIQLHGPDELGTNPAWDMSANDKITFGLRGGDIDQNPGRDYVLRNSSLNKGHWIDFIVTIKYSATNTGYVVVQRKDEGSVGYATALKLQNIATLQYVKVNNAYAVGNHYMKYGLYRNKSSFTSILYLANFIRESATANKLTNGNFETSGGWRTASATAVVNRVGVGATKGLRIGPTMGGIRQNISAPLIGTSYTLQLSGYVSNTSSPGHIYIGSYDAANHLISYQTITVTNTSYKTFAKTITIPATAKVLSVWANKSNTPGYFYTDNYTLTNIVP
jgi:hypothetical protein